MQRRRPRRRRRRRPELLLRTPCQLPLASFASGRCPACALRAQHPCAALGGAVGVLLASEGHAVGGGLDRAAAPTPPVAVRTVLRAARPVQVWVEVRWARSRVAGGRGRLSSRFRSAAGACPARVGWVGTPLAGESLFQPVTGLEDTAKRRGARAQRHCRCRVWSSCRPRTRSAAGLRAQRRWRRTGRGVPSRQWMTRSWGGRAANPASRCRPAGWQGRARWRVAQCPSKLAAVPSRTPAGDRRTARPSLSLRVGIVSLA
jgi:hypothetical protein